MYVDVSLPQPLPAVWLWWWQPRSAASQSPAKSHGNNQCVGKTDIVYHKSIYQNNITTNKTLSMAIEKTQVQAASHIYCGKNSCRCGCCLRLNSSVDRPILSWGSAVFEYRPPCSLYRFYGTLLSTSNPTFCSCVSRAPPVLPSGQSATLKQPASQSMDVRRLLPDKLR